MRLTQGKGQQVENIKRKECKTMDYKKKLIWHTLKGLEYDLAKVEDKMNEGGYLTPETIEEFEGIYTSIKDILDDIKQ